MITMKSEEEEKEQCQRNINTLVKCTWFFSNVIVYIINTKECQKHFKKLVIPFHFVSNIWEWDEK